MSTNPEADAASWEALNQRTLVALLDGLCRRLAAFCAPGEDGTRETPAIGQPAPPRGIPPPAIDTLAAAFALSPFERDLLLLCAGVALDGRLAALCAKAQGDPQRTAPTFSLALAVLPEAHWSALSPQAPLRRWRLIEPGAGPVLTQCPLLIDERVLHYLTGVHYRDERMGGLVLPVAVPGDLAPAHQRLADRVTAVWERTDRRPLPVIQLRGRDPPAIRAVAAAVCARLSLKLHRADAGGLPIGAAELDGFRRLWEREAALGGSALLLECADLDGADAGRTSAVQRFAEQLAGPLLLSAREGMPDLERMVALFDVAPPPRAERRLLWDAVLGPAAAQLGDELDALVEQFELGPGAIRAAYAAALADSADDERLEAALWEACRSLSRPQLTGLAQRIESPAAWDDLVLPDEQRGLLRAIAAQARQRATVYEAWGFAGRGARGLGISALFAGASGTGKTMAAEVLANELRLDLYRIDLSAVVSKYIGETEKNLRRVFDAAEGGGAVLLFDEADALFGKRSEVKDSHDRYANIEVSYLLQRMEAYRGLAILTTNLKSAIDPAFLRRIRFVVQFPFPDAAQRAQIWRRIFPPSTPTDGLDSAQLARLNVVGGNIRNIALGAAFLAADERAPVRMEHILQAARAEYAKLEKPLTEAELGART